MTVRDYFLEAIDRLTQDSFGQRNAPIVSLSEDTRDEPDGCLSGSLEVHVRTRNGAMPLIHTEAFCNVKGRQDVDDVLARALSVVLMNHAKWPR